MQGGVGSHGMADHVRPGDAERVHDRHHIGACDVLAVARRIARHLRGRIAARRKGDAAIQAREGAHLRLPGPVIAGEFVDENHWRAHAGFFVIELGAVAAGDGRHAVSRLWLGRDDFSSHRHLAVASCPSMIFSEPGTHFSGSCVSGRPWLRRRAAASRVR